MMYKKGDRWFVKDANFVMKMAHQYAGTPLEVLGGEAGGIPTLYAQMSEDIEFGETKTAVMIDESQDPVVVTTDEIEVTHGVFRVGKISSGKRIGYTTHDKDGGGKIFRIVAAECEDPDPVQIGG